MNVSNLNAPPAKQKGAVLAGVKAKRLNVPLRVLVYGQAGVGKSTFAASAPNPIFVGSEDGTAELEVARYPRDVETGGDILDAIEVLLTEEHEYKTIVLDTVDWAEPLIWKSLIEADKKDSIEEVGGGYGKGFTKAQEFWLRILKRLDVLRHERGMHVLLLGHTVIRTFKNPEGDDYDHYTLKMNEKSAGIIREWCDDVLFARDEVSTYKEKKGDTKAKAIATGGRVLHTTNRAAFFAKNRHSLPETIPFNWDAFWSAVESSRPESASSVKCRIVALLAQYALEVPEGAEEFMAKVRDATDAAGDDAQRLVGIANRLLDRIEEKRSKAQ